MRWTFFVWLGVLAFFSSSVFAEETISGANQHGRKRRDVSFNFKGQVIKVVTIQEEPYMYIKEDKDGNIKYSGFLKDYLDKIKKRLNVKFSYYRSPDGNFGSLVNGSWTGMIGELIKMENGQNENPPGEEGAQLVAAPLTITSGREEVIDFISPFQHLSLSMLIRKPFENHYVNDGDQWTQSFQILYPLAPEVWACCVLAYILVSGFLWLINKIDPYEWSARYDLGRADEEHNDTFNISGAFWYTFTTLQWQGYERSPRSLAARVLSAFWFMFVTLSLLTYTGALVNHLFWSSTAHGPAFMEPPFTTLEQLVMNKKWNYGIRQNSHSYKYLTEVARGDEFALMKHYWDNDGKKYLFNDEEDAIKRVKKGRYAIIAESMKVKYLANKNCDTMEIPTDVGKRAFGLGIYQGMDKDLVEAFHRVTLEMVEEGDIEVLEKKWWYGNGICWNLTKIENMLQYASKLELNKPKRVDIKVFWGPLLLILLGGILAAACLVGEVLYYKTRGRYSEANRPGGQQLKLEEET